MIIIRIGVTEKGYMTVKLTAHGAAGHSSMPPAESAIVTLAKAISKYEVQVSVIDFDSNFLDLNSLLTTICLEAVRSSKCFKQWHHL